MRSMKAFIMLGKVICRLQLDAFLNQSHNRSYDDEILSIIVIQDTWKKHDFLETGVLFNDLKKKIGSFVKDFSEFIEGRSEESEMFKYCSRKTNPTNARLSSS